MSGNNAFTLLMMVEIKGNRQQIFCWSVGQVTCDKHLCCITEVTIRPLSLLYNTPYGNLTGVGPSEAHGPGGLGYSLANPQQQRMTTSLH